MNTTTLENLPQQIKENRLKQFGENLVKYQNFKTNSIIAKIDNAGFSKGTLVSYVNSGISYIKTGKKFSQYGDFYKYIDEALKRCVQPLVPSKDDKRLSRPYNKSYINPQMTKDILRQNNQYAVQIGDNIRLLNNLECAKAFTDGLSFMGKTDAKIVKINIEEANEQL
jgi:hypothetical protein